MIEITCTEQEKTIFMQTMAASPICPFDWCRYAGQRPYCDSLCLHKRIKWNITED